MELITAAAISAIIGALLGIVIGTLIALHMLRGPWWN